MLLVGLSGGIGSGKTTVADCFSRKGVPILDADQISRELVQPGSPALAAIIETFGDGIIGEDKQLNRDALRRLVFNDDRKRQQLEQILHPRIRQRLLDLAAQLKHTKQPLVPYAILVIPLLFESGMTDLVQRTLVVDVPEELQWCRAAGRDGTDAVEIRRIMASQYGREQRQALADDIIDNSRDLEHLQSQVEELHRQYLKLAVQ